MKKKLTHKVGDQVANCYVVILKKQVFVVRAYNIDRLIRKLEESGHAVLGYEIVVSAEEQ